SSVATASWRSFAYSASSLMKCRISGAASSVAGRIPSAAPCFLRPARPRRRSTSPRTSPRSGSRGRGCRRAASASPRSLPSRAAHLPEHPLVAAREDEDVGQPLPLLRAHALRELLPLLLQPLRRLGEPHGRVHRDPVGVALVRGRSIRTGQALTHVRVAPGAR